MQIGRKFYGSPSIQISKENQEIVPEKIAFYKFSFEPFSDCTVRINGSDPILVRQARGFAMNEVDPSISSFVIVEAGIEFDWTGASK